MKPALFCIVLSALLLLTVCACGRKPEPAPEVSGEPKEITSFRFTHRGSETSQCFVYAMEATEEGVRLYYEGLYLGGPIVDCMIDELALSQLEVLARNNRLDNWDGFSKKAKNGSDGTGFNLSILYADGSSVYAEGSNRFPDGYTESKEAICELFEYLIEQYGETVPEDGANTNRTDPDAPKEIASDELKALHMRFFCMDSEGDGDKDGAYSFDLRQDEAEQWVLTVSGTREGAAVVNEEVAVSAQALIQEYDLAAQNGVYDVTAGLPPEYMPCDVSAVYASGEELYFTYDGEPETEWYAAFRDLFLQALAEAE